MQKLIELHEDSTYRVEIYCIGIGRITDVQNYDFIKLMMKPQDDKGMKEIYKRVGIINLFSPYHPEGSYELNLQFYEERMVFNMLCELAKKEGMDCIVSILYNKKSVDKTEFIGAAHKDGIVELVYSCDQKNAKVEARKNLGDKYLNWNTKIDFSLAPAVSRSPAKKHK